MKNALLSPKLSAAPACASCPSYATCPLAACGPEELALLLQNRHYLHFAKGQVIYHEGSACAGLYCVETGKIKISKGTAGGQEQIVRLGRPGDMLGLASLLGPAVYGASAVALDDTRVCLLPRTDVLGLLQGNSRFAVALTAVLARSVQQSDAAQLQLATRSVRERLAAALLLLLHTYRPADAQPFSIALSRDDLAALVGTVKETVSRLITQFKHAGLIATRGSRITILQEQQLRRLAAHAG